MCGIFVSARISTAHDEEGVFKKRCLELEEVNSARGMWLVIAIKAELLLVLVLFISGPDAQNNYAVHLPISFDLSTPCSNDTFSNNADAESKLSITFYASELRLRGTSFIVQPHLENGNVLCWNGEVQRLYVTVTHRLIF